MMILSNNHKLLKEGNNCVLYECYNGECTELEGFATFLKYYNYLDLSILTGYNIVKYFQTLEGAEADFKEREGICLY